MLLSQDQLDKLWEVATTIGPVEGWSADDQGDVHLLVPYGLENHHHYQRPATGGEWEKIEGMGSGHNASRS